MKIQDIFDRHGVGTIIIAQHIPLAGIFIPLLCAVSGMRFTWLLTLIAISSIIGRLNYFTWSLFTIAVGYRLIAGSLPHLQPRIRQCDHHRNSFHFPLLIFINAFF